MKKQIIWYVVAALIVAALGWFMFAPVETKVDTSVQEEKPKAKTKKVEKKTTKKSQALDQKKERKAAAEKPKIEIVEEEDDGYTPAERQVANKVQSALDEDDFKALQAQLEAAANSTNVALRQAAVEALAWFGVKALPELTMFMADSDDDVRDAACNAWTASISEIEDKNVRASAVLSAMNVVYDRNHLDSMVMEINDMSNAKQIDILTQLINGKNKLAAETAKEHYEFVTGEEYKDLDTAKKWLAENPDESDEAPANGE